MRFIFSEIFCKFSQRSHHLFLKTSSSVPLNLLFFFFTRKYLLRILINDHQTIFNCEIITKMTFYWYLTISESRIIHQYNVTLYTFMSHINLAYFSLIPWHIFAKLFETIFFFFYPGVIEFLSFFLHNETSCVLVRQNNPNADYALIYVHPYLAPCMIDEKSKVLFFVDDCQSLFSPSIPLLQYVQPIPRR